MGFDLKKIFDKNYNENFVLEGKDNVKIEMKRIAIVTFDNKTGYIIFKPVSPALDLEENEVLVYEIAKDGKSISLVTDKKIEQMVLDEYNNN